MLNDIMITSFLKNEQKQIQVMGKKNSSRRGFVILFAMMVASIILIVSTTMYNISKKATIVSSFARESQRAFYAANSALECALFHDVSDYLTNGTAFPVDATSGYTTDINCAGNTFPVRLLNTANGTGGTEQFDHSFVFRYPAIDNANIHYYDTGCAYVLVEKKLGVDGSLPNTKEVETRVTAVGFNTCKFNSNDNFYDIPDYDDPTLLERRMSSTYTTLYYVGP